MKNSRLVSVLIVLTGVLLLPARSNAEIVIAESMEWVLLTSERVVVAKVDKLDTMLDRDGKECQLLSLAISKTFKGEHAQRETVLLRPYIFKGYAKQWMDDGIPLVFCLLKNDEKRVTIPAERCGWVVRDAGNDPDVVLLGKSKHQFSGCTPLLTREYAVLTEADEILKFVEKNAQTLAKEKTPVSHKLHVPGDTAVHKKLWSMSAVFLVVPADQELEALGRKWSQSEFAGECAEGAKILGLFKNEQNIEILKTLLKDASSYESTKGKSVAGQLSVEFVWRKRFYNVRQAAFDSLRNFGAKVEQPILEELLEGRNEEGEKKP